MRGSRNRLSEAVICALLRDFSKHGEKAIAKVRQTQPAAYLEICGLLVPREIKLWPSGGLSAMTDEQLDAALDALREMLAARHGEAANVIRELRSLWRYRLPRRSPSLLPRPTYRATEPLEDRARSGGSRVADNKSCWIARGATGRTRLTSGPLVTAKFLHN